MTEASPQVDSSVPACFGLLWEAVGDSPCVHCTVKNGCLKQFAGVQLPRIRQTLGDNPSLEELCAAAGGVEIDEGAPLRQEAMLIAIDFEKALEKSSSGDGASGNVAESWDDGSQETLQQAYDGDQPKIPVEEQQSEKPAEPEPRRKKRKPPTEEQAVANPKVAKAKRSSKKKKAAAPGAKKKTKRKASSTKAVQNPPKAESAKRARDSASPKGTGKKKKSAPPARAQQAGGKDWMARWRRERKRSPQIGKLTPGCVVRGEYPQYSGTFHEVKVLKGKYQYQEKDYPTLYSVVIAITGTVARPQQLEMAGDQKSRPKGTRPVSNWSAVKFFQTALNDR